ncbi:MAG: histidine kinase, partial [Bacteroidota bacterium]
AQHETEKKEQAITSLTQENAIQDLQLKQQRLGLLGGGIVTLLVISLGWVILRQRNLKAQQIQWNLERNLLRTQMNPHFIFNSLASIQSFVLRKDNKKAVLYLAKFGELTRDILEASRQDFVPLEQEIRMVSNYVALEQARFGKTLNLEIDIGDLDAENITIPPMLIQPFLENSIQHGSATRDQGDIHLKISEKDNKLKVIVEDNGTGLAEGAMNSNKSLAIKITRERLQHIHQGGGKVLLQVTNRKDPEGHILGVRVQFELPLRYAF